MEEVMESVPTAGTRECEFIANTPLFQRIADGTGQRLCTSPGDNITEGRDYTSGHGTYVNNGNICSGAAGILQIVSSFLTVQSYLGRYMPYAGQMVIGRVRRVLRDRWQIDIGADKDAVLLLSAVNLPGSELRRRSAIDEMNMRNHFVEGDLLYAEVQKAGGPQAPASLQTRSSVCGKLEYGLLLDVPHTTTAGVSVRIYPPTPSTTIVVADNGRCWVAPTRHTPGERLDPAVAQEISQVIDSVRFLTKHDIPIRQDAVVARIRAHSSNSRADHTEVMEDKGE